VLEKVLNNNEIFEADTVEKGLNLELLLKEET